MDTLKEIRNTMAKQATKIRFDELNKELNKTKHQTNQDIMELQAVKNNQQMQSSKAKHFIQDVKKNTNKILDMEIILHPLEVYYTVFALRIPYQSLQNDFEQMFNLQLFKKNDNLTRLKKRFSYHKVPITNLDDAKLTFNTFQIKIPKLSRQHLQLLTPKLKDKANQITSKISKNHALNKYSVVNIYVNTYLFHLSLAQRRKLNKNVIIITNKDKPKIANAFIIISK